MIRYILLSGVMTVIGVMLALYISRSKSLCSRELFIVMGVLLLLTAVFDSLIIASGIVAYNSDYILGVYIGTAPIEDFLYTIVVVPLVIALWEYYEKNK